MGLDDGISIIMILLDHLKHPLFGDITSAEK
jgi:hypothetical protein